MSVMVVDRKHGNKGFVLKIDIHHYFESINHDILFAKLEKKVKDPKVMRLIKQIVKTSNKGLGLGSQVSQICAMFYLNELDHYIKEKYRFKYYGRYADDIYILSSNKRALEGVLFYIERMFKNNKLSLNIGKTKIYKLENGFIFCKTRYKLLKSGKILKLLVSKSVKSMKKKIKRGVDLSNIVPSFLSYMDEFNSHCLLLKLKRQYKIFI